MALRACEDCGSQFSDQSAACLACGMPRLSARPPMALALHVLIHGADSSSRVVGEFGNWTSAGAGAMLALVLTTRETLRAYIDLNSLDWAMRWLTVVLGFGFAQAICRVWVANIAGALRVPEDAGLYTDPEAFNLFKTHANRAAFPHSRWFGKVTAGNAEDPMSVGRRVLIWAQVQGHFVLGQFLAVLIAVGILIEGLK